LEPKFKMHRLEDKANIKIAQNVFLYETMLRPRYYLNPADIKYEFLTESETTSYCPYKGMAKYAPLPITLLPSSSSSSG
jgi:uncharacterized protein (DUF427 family)